ncbi:MAG: Uma2 family endonuclease [Myxococcaceae bacterium]|nr:Uma2 family endonuclease [Myxococcaceae bacterium]
MTAQRKPLLSYEEYLALEASTPETRHEYLRGEVWAMAGGTPEHALYATNFISLIRTSLKGKPCAPYGSDLRVRVEATDRTTYPDGIVICGPREVSTRDQNAIVNPTLILEVTSDGTEAEDRGEKFAHYRHLASLQEYVIVSHRQQRIEVYRREAASWGLREYRPGTEVELASLGVRVAVSGVYEDPNRPTSP